MDINRLINFNISIDFIDENVRTEDPNCASYQEKTERKQQPETHNNERNEKQGFKKINKNNKFNLNYHSIN